LLLYSGSIVGTWRYTPRKASSEAGAQIDLLFDRDDSVITLVEIKYTDNPFIITKEYAQKLKNKIDVFKKVTRTKKQIFLDRCEYILLLISTIVIIIMFISLFKELNNFHYIFKFIFGIFMCLILLLSLVACVINYNDVWMGKYRLRETGSFIY